MHYPQRRPYLHLRQFSITPHETRCRWSADGAARKRSSIMERGLERKQITKVNYGQHVHEGPGRDSFSWDMAFLRKRVHRNWRFWVGMFSMMAAIAIYVMSDNLAIPAAQPTASGTATVGRG
jgi:hypothetical protein